MQSETDKKTQSPKIIAIIVGIAVFALLLGVLVSGYLMPYGKLKSLLQPKLPEEIASVYIPDGRPLAGIRMTDHNGQPFTEARFKGKWSFMFFGYTHCPDVCPTTMLIMKAVWARLPDSARQAPQPQMLFISVDPDRDTPELMKTYATYYNPEFLGLTAEHKYLDILTTQVGALYGYEDGENSEQYVVNHSAQLILIDPQGHFRAVFSPPLQVDDIVKKFTAIREYHSEK